MSLPTYSTGTASVAAGGTVVTGSGTLWSGINAKQGDFISIGGSDAVLITEVTDATHLKVTPWPDAAKTSQPYILYQSYVGRVVGVAAAEDVGVMLEKLHTDGLPFIVGASEAVPDPSYGDDGQMAFKPTTGQWWVKSGGAWVLSSGLSALGYGGTSTTSLTIGIGTKVFTTQANLAYNGARVRAASSASPANFMEGIATYSGTSLSLAVDATGGSGTFASWLFSIAGTPGASGSGTGDVLGPASAVADRIAVFNGTTGKTIKDGGQLISGLAPLASPALTGNPTAPTPTAGDNDTSIATTAFVTAAVAPKLTDAPVDTFLYGRKDAAWVKVGGVDLVTPVSIAAITTLTASAFGKLHVISGTSANYTVTLPTPVGNAGALIGFQVNLPASASKLYTLSTPAGAIGRHGTTLILWAGETLLLRSDGTNWIIIDGKPNPFSGELVKTTAQSFTSGSSFVEVTFTAGAVDPTGLNLCFDGTRFVAPRPGAWLINFYLYGTQGAGTFYQAALFDTAFTAGLTGVFAHLGSLASATIAGYGKLQLAAAASAKMGVRADGTTPIIAGNTITSRLSYSENPVW